MKTISRKTPLTTTRKGSFQSFYSTLWCAGLCLLLLCITSCASAPSPVALLRGYQVIVIRLPVESGQMQEDVVIGQDDQGRYVVYRGPSNHHAQGVTPAQYTQTALAEQQWKELNLLRTYWCNARPPSQPIQGSQQRYAVAVQCEGGAPYETLFASDQLPDELRHVLERAPKGNSTLRTYVSRDDGDAAEHAQRLCEKSDADPLTPPDPF